MTFAEWEIVGGDYLAAGRASAQLKDRLKQIGTDPGVVRRTLIAAYEAEANVVIHAHRGWLRAYFGPGQLDVELEDEGPGIPDIELALREGYSTAPAAARELGFGAGMGLPNIRRTADRFAVQSTPGRGTRVTFTIRYRPQDGGGVPENSLRIDPARCRRCLHCLLACPTAAVRVRDAGPQVLEHLCIDCTACLAACVAGALAMRGGDEPAPRRPGTTLVVPVSLLRQFGGEIGADAVRAALARLGFAEVLSLGSWEDALRRAAAERLRSPDVARPTILPGCPAVLNLVAMRFPSLLDFVAPFASPLEAARRDLADRCAAFVALCPGQRTVLTRAMGGSHADVVAPAGLLCELLTVLGRRALNAGGSASDGPAVPPRAASCGDVPSEDGILRATGIRRVARVLERAEQGRLGDVGLLELWACEQGCAGSPLLREEASVANYRARGDAPESPPRSAQPRREPLPPRPGLRLDADMAAAVAKLGRIDRLLGELPGRDCGACGAPTCAALAEDVALERVSVASCPYREERKEAAP